MKTNTRLLISFLFMICAQAFIVWMVWKLNAFPVTGHMNPFYIYLAQFAALPFIIMAIVDVNSSEYIDKKQKTMWTFGFLVLTLISGILYLVSERKRLVANS